MTLADLQMDQEVTYRTGRPGSENVMWRTGKLYVQRVPRDVRGRAKKGQLAALTIRGISWAEYGADSWSNTYRVFEAEGYYLEIKGLV